MSNLAVSWQIAYQLIRLHQDARIYETHPGGGMYDCLAIRCEHFAIDINRAGSVHVLASLKGEHLNVVGSEEWTSQPVADTVQRVVEVAGINPRKEAMQPHSLSYRVIARTLSAHQLQGVPWDARQQWEDTSGYVDNQLRWPVPSPEMQQLPANQIWALLTSHDSEEPPAAWFWDGWCWNGSGERINLWGRYQRGARIDELVALVTLKAKGAVPLPAVRLEGEQPIGEWPKP